MLQVLQACPRALLYKTLFRRRTPLMLAAEGGGVESLLKLMWAAERLLGGAAFQAYLDEADARGNTALLLAAKRGCAGAGGLPAQGRALTPSFPAAPSCPPVRCQESWLWGGELESPLLC